MNPFRIPPQVLHRPLLLVLSASILEVAGNDGQPPSKSRIPWDCTAPVPASSVRWHLDLADPAGSAEGVAIDPAGDTLVTGSISGTGTDLDPLGSRAVLAPNLGGSDIVLARYDTLGHLRWHRTLGGVGDDIGRSVAVCPDGSVVVAGSFEGSAIFGAVLWVPLGLVSKGRSDAFVARYDASGNLLWARQIGGSGEDSALDLSVGSDGAIFVCGHFSGTADIGPVSGSHPLVSHGSSDAFLIRFESDGRVGWARQVGGTSTDVGLGVAVGGDQVVLCGYSRSTRAWAGSHSFSNAGGADAFTATYQLSDGTESGAESYGGSQDDIAYDVATAADGATYVTGLYRGTASFGGLPGRTGGDARALSTPEAFVLKLGADSRPEWLASTRQSGNGTDSTGRAEAYGVAVSPSGCHVYLCGRFVGSVDFDPGTGEAWRRDGIDGYCPNDRGFVWALDRDGQLAWTEVLGDEGVCSANAIAVRGFNRLAVAGMSDFRNSCESTGRAKLFLRSK